MALTQEKRWRRSPQLRGHPLGCSACSAWNSFQTVDKSWSLSTIMMLEVGHVEVAQQPKQRVGVRQGLQFGEQQPQVGLELRARQLAVDGTPGGELKDEHQQPVEQQHGEPMPALLGLAGVGNLLQTGEQGGQLPAQDAQLSADRRLAGLLFLGDGGVSRAAIR